jgi:isopentenyl-diphosphate delta-isomerase type 1
MPKDNKSELFYHVDENDKVLGSVTREIAHSDRSKIHRAVDIWVKNGSKILLQKRSLEKDTFPGYWTISAGGHVSYGENYFEAAKRELKEEIGIETKLKPIGKKLFDTGIEQEFSSVYECEYSGEHFNLDKTEVKEVMWVEVEKLDAFIAENKITPSAKQSLVFAGYINKM